MAYVYNQSETYPEANRIELIDSANRGRGGSGAIVEAMFRLMESIGAEERAIKTLTMWLLIVTVAIGVLTVGLVWLGWAQLHPTTLLTPPPRFSPPI